VNTVTAELTSGTAVHLADGRHNWVSDQPPDAQGTDLGPSPYELLLGALASCTCVTLALYCRHKGIELHSVRAVYTHEVRSDGGQAAIDRITGDVRIVGKFDDAQRKRLADIARRCPVHNTLRAGVAIRDHVSFG